MRGATKSAGAALSFMLGARFGSLGSRGQRHAGRRRQVAGRRQPAAQRCCMLGGEGPLAGEERARVGAAWPQAHGALGESAPSMEARGASREGGDIRVLAVRRHSLLLGRGRLQELQNEIGSGATRAGNERMGKGVQERGRQLGHREAAKAERHLRKHWGVACGKKLPRSGEKTGEKVA